MENDSTKEKYMRYQEITQTLEKVQQKMEQLDVQLNQVQETVQSLNDLDTLDVGSEMLVPIGNGIFIKGALKKTDELLVNVGAGTVVPKSVDDAKKLIGKQLKSIEEYRGQLMMQMQLMQQEAQMIEQEVMKE